MAESSSSGEDSSEEEDNEVSPSLRGSVIPNTAGSKTSEKKPGLFSERGYLKTLSRQERRRIKREIRKGHKPALTVNNITNTLAGIDWRRIGEDIVGLPESKCDEISSQCSTDEERAGAVVREWLLRDPLASWRRIIEQLYKMELLETKYRTLGDSILHYTEELTDTSLIHSNLTKVLLSVASRDLRYCLDMPETVSRRIFSDCDDGEQRREQRMHYYITCSPYALLGWNHIAGELHYWVEETAERAAKDYVQKAPEPSLDLDNLYTVLEGINEGRLDQNIPTVVAWLHIPEAKREELRQQYPVIAQRKRAYSVYYLAHHPGPTWRIIATALWETKELGALEVVQKLKDINLQSLCLVELSRWLKSESEVDRLPLPTILKDKLKDIVFLDLYN